MRKIGHKEKMAKSLKAIDKMKNGKRITLSPKTRFWLSLSTGIAVTGGATAGIAVAIVQKRNADTRPFYSHNPINMNKYQYNAKLDASDVNVHWTSNSAMEANMGPIKFKDSYPLLMSEDLLRDVATWFYHDVPWGPEISTLKSISFLTGVQMKGSSVVHGYHTAPRSGSDIVISPDVVFDSTKVTHLNEGMAFWILKNYSHIATAAGVTPVVTKDDTNISASDYKTFLGNNNIGSLIYRNINLYITKTSNTIGKLLHKINEAATTTGSKKTAVQNVLKLDKSTPPSLIDASLDSVITKATAAGVAEDDILTDIINVWNSNEFKAFISINYSMARRTKSYSDAKYRELTKPTNTTTLFESDKEHILEGLKGTNGAIPRDMHAETNEFIFGISNENEAKRSLKEYALGKSGFLSILSPQEKWNNYVNYLSWMLARDSITNAQIIPAFTEDKATKPDHETQVGDAVLEYLWNADNINKIKSNGIYNGFNPDNVDGSINALYTNYKQIIKSALHDYMSKYSTKSEAEIDGVYQNVINNSNALKTSLANSVVEVSKHIQHKYKLGEFTPDKSKRYLGIPVYKNNDSLLQSISRRAAQNMSHTLAHEYGHHSTLRAAGDISRLSSAKDYIYRRANEQDNQVSLLAAEKKGSIDNQLFNKEIFNSLIDTLKGEHADKFAAAMALASDGDVTTDLVDQSFDAIVAAGTNDPSDMYKLGASIQLGSVLGGAANPSVYTFAEDFASGETQMREVKGSSILSALNIKQIFGKMDPTKGLPSVTNPFGELDGYNQIVTAANAAGIDQDAVIQAIKSEYDDVAKAYDVLNKFKLTQEGKPTTSTLTKDTSIADIIEANKFILNEQDLNDAIEGLNDVFRFVGGLFGEMGDRAQVQRINEIGDLLQSPEGYLTLLEDYQQIVTRLLSEGKTLSDLNDPMGTSNLGLDSRDLMTVLMSSMGISGLFDPLNVYSEYPSDVTKRLKLAITKIKLTVAINSDSGDATLRANATIIANSSIKKILDSLTDIQKVSLWKGTSVSAQAAAAQAIVGTATTPKSFKEAIDIFLDNFKKDSQENTDGTIQVKNDWQSTFIEPSIGMIPNNIYKAVVAAFASKTTYDLASAPHDLFRNTMLAPQGTTTAESVITPMDMKLQFLASVGENSRVLVDWLLNYEIAFSHTESIDNGGVPKDVVVLDRKVKIKDLLGSVNISKIAHLYKSFVSYVYSQERFEFAKTLATADGSTITTTLDYLKFIGAINSVGKDHVSPITGGLIWAFSQSLAELNVGIDNVTPYTWTTDAQGRLVRDAKDTSKIDTDSQKLDDILFKNNKMIFKEIPWNTPVSSMFVFSRSNDYENLIHQDMRTSSPGTSAPGSVVRYQISYVETLTRLLQQLTWNYPIEALTTGGNFYEGDLLLEASFGLTLTNSFANIGNVHDGSLTAQGQAILDFYNKQIFGIDKKVSLIQKDTNSGLYSFSGFLDENENYEWMVFKDASGRVVHRAKLHFGTAHLTANQNHGFNFDQRKDMITENHKKSYTTDWMVLGNFSNSQLASGEYSVELWSNPDSKGIINKHPITNHEVKNEGQLNVDGKADDHAEIIGNRDSSTDVNAQFKIWVGNIML